MTMPPITPPTMPPIGVLFFFLLLLVLVLPEGGRTSIGSIEVSVEPGAVVMRVKDTEAALLVDVLVLPDVDEPLNHTVSREFNLMYGNH